MNQEVKKNKGINLAGTPEGHLNNTKKRVKNKG